MDEISKEDEILILKTWEKKRRVWKRKCSAHVETTTMNTRWRYFLMIVITLK